MARFHVRIFGYRGLRQIPVTALTHDNADSMVVLDEPYMWSQLIPVGAEAAESVSQPGDTAILLQIEVPDGQAVRYEINPHGPGTADHRKAGELSPRLTGSRPFAWYQGGTVSLIDDSELL